MHRPLPVKQIPKLKSTGTTKPKQNNTSKTSTRRDHGHLVAATIPIIAVTQSNVTPRAPSFAPKENNAQGDASPTDLNEKRSGGQTASSVLSTEHVATATAHAVSWLMADHTRARPSSGPPPEVRAAHRVRGHRVPGDPRTSVVVPRLCCCCTVRSVAFSACWKLTSCALIPVVCPAASFISFWFCCDAVGDNAGRGDGDGEGGGGHEGDRLLDSCYHGEGSGPAAAAGNSRRSVIFMTHP